MSRPVFEQLSHEKQVLVRQTMDHLSPCHAPERHLVYRIRDGKQVYENRASLYYALGLMLMGKKEIVQSRSPCVMLSLTGSLMGRQRFFMGRTFIRADNAQ